MRFLGTGSLAGVPVSIWTAAIVAAAAIVVTRGTRFGLRLYAVGGNPTAAAAARVSPQRIKLAAFTLTGVLTGVAALVTVPQQSVIESGIGVGFELVVVTAVVVGGTSIRGGHGGIAGTVLAAVLLGSVRTALVFLDLGESATYWERAIQGAFILAAVLADRGARRGETRDEAGRVEAPARPASAAHEIVLAALLVGVLAVAWRLEPALGSLAVQLELSTHALELALVAVPMTLIIVAGGIDLSVGSAMALSSVAFGLLVERGAGVPIAGAAALLAGAAAGAINGAFVALARLHPLIVTLATLAAYRGLAEGLSLGRPMSGFPPWFLGIATATAGGVPVLLLLVLGLGVAAGLLMRFTTAGPWIRAMGDNERAARYAAVPVGRLKFALYTLSGLAAGAAALIFAARRNTAKADVGAGLELEVITAVVLGGASITGGRGRILGTILGVAIIQEVRELVSWHWQRDELILIAIGSILVASVVLKSAAPARRA